MSDIKEALQEIGYSNITDNGKYYRMRPIYRDSTNNTSLSVDKETGFFRDFSSNQRGSFSDLVKLTLNLKSSDEAKRWIVRKGVSDSKVVKQKPEAKHHRVFAPSEIESYKPDHSYWENRGIPLEILNKFNGGVCESGKMMGRYVFPIYSLNEKIIGLAGRDVLKKKANNGFERPKWKLMGDKSKWTFPVHVNFSLLQERKKVILVESIGDALSLMTAGINNILVTFGTDISVEIINLLLKIDPERITISLNNDYDNNNIGNKASYKIKTKLLKYFDQHQVKVMLPTKNDFGEMTKAEIMDWAYGRTKG